MLKNDLTHITTIASTQEAQTAISDLTNGRVGNKFRLKTYHHSPENMSQILNLLADAVEVEIIELPHQAVISTMAPAIAKLIQKPGLQLLNVSGCELGDEGGKTLITALEKRSHAQKLCLDLSFNDMGESVKEEFSLLISEKKLPLNLRINTNNPAIQKTLSSPFSSPFASPLQSPYSSPFASPTAPRTRKNNTNLQVSSNRQSSNTTPQTFGELVTYCNAKIAVIVASKVAQKNNSEEGAWFGKTSANLDAEIKALNALKDALSAQPIRAAAEIEQIIEKTKAAHSEGFKKHSTSLFQSKIQQISEDLAAKAYKIEANIKKAKSASSLGATNNNNNNTDTLSYK